MSEQGELVQRLRLEGPVSSLYRAMHEYRDAPRPLLFVLGVTMAVQFVRIVARTAEVYRKVPASEV